MNFDAFSSLRRRIPEEEDVERTGEEGWIRLSVIKRSDNSVIVTQEQPNVGQKEMRNDTRATELLEKFA